jgi:hypothetical protein
LTYCEPLCIITFSHAKQSFEGVISWNHESSEIGKELTSNVEEDEEEVGCDKAKKGVNLGNGSLFLQVVQGRVLGELSWQKSVDILLWAQRTGQLPVSSGLNRREGLSHLLIYVAQMHLSFILERRHVCVLWFGLQRC